MKEPENSEREKRGNWWQERLVQRIESGPKISVWWLAVLLVVSMALSAMLAALDVWLKR